MRCYGSIRRTNAKWRNRAMGVEVLEHRQLLSGEPTIDQFTVLAISPYQATIQYAVSSGASVQVWMKGSADLNFHTVSTARVDDNTVKVVGLNASTDYAFELAAEEDALVTYSAEQSLTAPAESGVYPAISGLSVTGQDCWSAPTIHLQGSWSGPWSPSLGAAVEISVAGHPECSALE